MAGPQDPEDPSKRAVGWREVAIAAAVVVVMTFLWEGPTLFPGNRLVSWIHGAFLMFGWPLLLLAGAPAVLRARRRRGGPPNVKG